jgi:predicted TIM-barrel fold metal-dependent hydrolase
MLRRWLNASSRQLWIDALLHVASRAMLIYDWRIEHPPAWPQTECEDLRRHLVQLGVTAPVFVAYDDIKAGLRIIARGATIDATLVGLLQRKTAIEAVLMARLMPLVNNGELQAPDSDHHG